MHFSLSRVTNSTVGVSKHWIETLTEALMRVASAVSRESNIDNITHHSHSDGCVGLHCLVADEVEDNFMESHGSSRMLASNTHK
ncbi:Kelch-like protein 21 [Sesbania bispinosa]|nr:Kelch-like protein 21 [Sesbania bispinosa]